MIFRKVGGWAQPFSGCFCYSWQLGWSQELMNCWCDPIILGEVHGRMQGKHCISNGNVSLETVGMFAKKMNQCISCFKKAFMRCISKAAYFHRPRVPLCYNTFLRTASVSKERTMLRQQCHHSSLRSLKRKLTWVFKISFIVDFSIKDLNYLVTWAETDLIQSCCLCALGCYISVLQCNSRIMNRLLASP